MRPALVALALVLCLAATARAATIGVSSTVAAGSAISVAAGSSPSFSVTLNGADQATPYTLPVTVTDATGSGSGWNLTITSTIFNDGHGHTFPATASTITGVTGTCASGSTCTVPTNNVGDTNLAVPAATSAPGAVKYFNATAGTGLGKVNVNATVDVAVPANVLAGSYSSTVTVAVVSGP
jgi:WxL domain surface cell wall-binding